MYNTTTACIIYLGLLRGSNDLTATTGGSSTWHEIVMRTPLACLWTLYLVLHFTREHFTFCPSPAVKKAIIHIAFKCIAWSSYLCVNRPIWRSVNKTKLKVTASYRYYYTTANLNAMSAMTIGTISQHSTIGNH